MFLVLDQYSVGKSTRVAVFPSHFDGRSLEADNNASARNMTDPLGWLDNMHALLQHGNLLLSQLSRL